MPRPLRILAVLSDLSASGYPALDLEKEHRYLEESAHQDGVELVVLKDARRETLAEVLAKGRFHILHFSGHGWFDEQLGEGGLCFKAPDGSAEQVSGSALATELSAFRDLQLIFLNACSTAQVIQDEQRSPFLGAATALVLAGLPSVLAMRVPIADSAAIVFSRAFYQHLLLGDRIETALFHGRLAISRLDPSSAEWSTPVLFLRSQENIRAAQPIAPRAALESRPVLRTVFAWAPPGFHRVLARSRTLSEPLGRLADTQYFPEAQISTDTCAIRCQELILRQFTGVGVPEKILAEEAHVHEWFTDDRGTSPGDVGNLLELHGIPVNRYQHGNVYKLTAELAKGHKVIIGVDSHEHRVKPIPHEIHHALGLGGPADHAIVVAGIDTSDPHTVHVIVSDPGSGEAAARYPIQDFIASWRGSDFFMVATQEPPPVELRLPEMRNFDYESGHLEHIGDLPYDHFEQLFHEHAAHPGTEEGELLRAIGGPHDDESHWPHAAGYGDHDEDLDMQPHLGHDLDEAHDHDIGFPADDHHDGDDHE